MADGQPFLHRMTSGFLFPVYLQPYMFLWNGMETYGTEPNGTERIGNDMEWDGTEPNGTERNRTEPNGTEMTWNGMGCYGIRGWA